LLKLRALLTLIENTTTMSSKVITITPVILEEEKDWIPWIEVIRTAAGDL